MGQEHRVLDEFIRSRRLRYTFQRKKILSVFLSVEGHMSIEELFKHVRRQFPKIGFSTVYRTMKLLAASGLCRQLNFGDGASRFEHQYNHQHHDHLICTKCGKCIEVWNPRLERIQEEVTRKNDFTPFTHKLEIFGLCSSCVKVPR